MTVFTLLLCGTGLTAERNDEHIAWLGSQFGQNQALTEGKDWLIHDGPGSGYREEDVKKYRNPNFPRYYQAQGVATGAGVNEIRDNAVEVITKNKDKITQLNIVGWSRGAWNALRVANILARNPETAHIRVNILAFEPVPGIGNHDLSGLSLPPTVDNYVSLIALHEHSLGFSPVVPVSENTKTQTHIYTVPGSHSALVGVYTRTLGIDLYGLYAVPDLTKRYMIRTLHAWGTPIENDTQDDTNLWKEVYTHHAEFEKFANTSYTLSFESYKTDFDTKDKKYIYHRKISTLDDNKKNISAYLPDLGLSFQQDSQATYDRFNLDLVPETCTLHREFNDSVLIKRARTLYQLQSPTSEQTEELTELIDFLEIRQDSRADDNLTNVIAALRTEPFVFEHINIDDDESQESIFDKILEQCKKQIEPKIELPVKIQFESESEIQSDSSRSSVSSVLSDFAHTNVASTDADYYAEKATQAVLALCVTGVIVTAVFTGGLSAFFGLAALQAFSGYVLCGAVGAPALTYYGMQYFNKPTIEKSDQRMILKQ